MNRNGTRNTTGIKWRPWAMNPMHVAARFALERANHAFSIFHNHRAAVVHEIEADWALRYAVLTGPKGTGYGPGAGAKKGTHKQASPKRGGGNPSGPVKR
jgi:hypothetical protein